MDYPRRRLLCFWRCLRNLFQYGIRVLPSLSICGPGQATSSVTNTWIALVIGIDGSNSSGRRVFAWSIREYYINEPGPSFSILRSRSLPSCRNVEDEGMGKILYDLTS